MACKHWMDGTGPVPGCTDCDSLVHMATHASVYRVHDYAGRIITPTLMSMVDDDVCGTERKPHKASKGKVTRRKARKIHRVG